MRSEHWPLRAYLISVFGSVVLIVAVLSHLYAIATFHDRIGFGALGYWSPPDRCFIVSPGTAVSWPALAEDLLRPSDCIDTLNGVALAEHKDDDGYLTHLLAQVPAGQLLTLRGHRDRQPLLVEVAALRLTVARLLEMQLALFIPGLALWLMGWPVLLARPASEGNRVLAMLLFLGALLVMCAIDPGLPSWVGRLYGWLFVWSGRPFLGALLFQLTFLFPEPPVRHFLQRWRFVLYLPAAIAFIFGIGIHLGPERLGDWLQPLHLGQNAVILSLFMMGSLAFFGRMFIIWRHSPSAQAAHQAALLVLAILATIPLVVMNMLFYDLRLPWILPRASNGTFAYWMVSAAALLAYSMLRYQAFAYRGVALSALVVLMVSAALTQSYSFFLAPRGWDGIQFVTVWGAVLLTTLFWFADSPLRHGFRRLFVRHEFDFQITDRFSQQMTAATGVDDVLMRSVRTLCNDLEVAWAAVASIQRPKQFCLAAAEKPNQPPLVLTVVQPESHLPGRASLVHTITDGDRHVGTIWLGPRTTAEPMDAKDDQLVMMLGQELARTLAVHAYIEDLEQVPGRILTAVETDRNRIGQDLHDSVLQFLGAITLELDRAARLVERDPVQAQAILERAVDQAEIVSQETRASVYDLSPPFLLRQGVVAASRDFAEQACASHGVIFTWGVDANTEAAWRQLLDAQAIQVYRIVQQAVDNALSHANPTTLTVRFSHEGNELAVQVIDNGYGFTLSPPSSPIPAQSATSGIGLVSMQARAKSLAGTLAVTSVPGAGTTVMLRFPGG